MFDEQKQQAIAILKRRNKENWDSETFIDNAAGVVGVGNLPYEKKKPGDFRTQEEWIKYQKRINYLSTLAFALLLDIINKPSVKIPSVPVYRAAPEEESKALAVVPDQGVKTTSTEIEVRGEVPPSTATPIPDYYGLLGVDKNASPEEIDRAYRKISRLKHPDFIEGQLRKQGLSTSEIRERLQKATREMQDVNAAYTILGGKRNRKDYDDVKKESEKTAAQPPPTTAAGATDKAPQTGKAVVIKLQSTIPESPEVVKARGETKEFRELVDKVGKDLDLTPEEIHELHAMGKLPDGFQGKEAGVGAALYAKGVDPEELLLKSERSVLTEGEKDSLARAAYEDAAFKEARLKNTPSYEILRTSNQNPEIVSIEEAAPQVLTAPPQPNQIPLQSVSGPQGESFQLPSAVTGKIEGKIEQKVLKSTTVSALKKGGQKFLAKTGLTQVGTRLAMKFGATATATALRTALGASGPVGWAIMAGQIVGGKILGALKRFIFGNRDFQIRKRLKKGLKYLLFGIGFIVLYPLFWPLVITGVVVVVTPLLVMLILHIITTGAYVVPQYFNPIYTPGVQTNPYISVTKTASPTQIQNSDLNDDETITYTVVITALQGALTDISIEYTCRVIRDGTIPDCPTPQPDFTRNPAPILPPGNQIPAGGTHTFTYTQTFTPNSNFDDSIVLDTITVRGFVAGIAPIQTVTASASVIIGNPPTECPREWPMRPNPGEPAFWISRGPYSVGTHSSVEAVDIATNGINGYSVRATHSGTAIVPGFDSGGFGFYVEIESNCEVAPGTVVVFRSRYAHLSSRSVAPGPVAFGQEVGKSGSTGNSSGPHLHYEFRVGGQAASYPNRPPYMWTHYIPENVPRGCSDYATCGNPYASLRP